MPTSNVHPEFLRANLQPSTDQHQQRVTHRQAIVFWQMITDHNLVGVLPHRRLAGLVQTIPTVSSSR